MASFFTLHFLPFSMASTATYSLGTQQSFTGRRASGDGSLGGSRCPISSPGTPGLECPQSGLWVSPMPVTFVYTLLSWSLSWGLCMETGPLLWNMQLALAIGSFVAKEVSMGKVNTEHTRSFHSAPVDKWLQVVSQTPKVVQALVLHVAVQAHASRLISGYWGFSLVSFIPEV